MSEWQSFRSAMKQAADKGVVLFTGAHQVVGLRRYIETMTELCKKDAKMLGKVSREVLECCEKRDLEGCFLAVQGIKNVGPFLAWQIVCDLMESQCLKPCTEDDWTKLGPGAESKYYRVAVVVISFSVNLTISWFRGH